MNFESPRAFRKNMSLEGLIFLNDREHRIVVRNLSITGLLAELDPRKPDESDLGEWVNSLNKIKLVDIFLPSMQLAGEMEVIRAESEYGKIQLALEFKSISYDVAEFIYKRRMYRKRIEGGGKILLEGSYHAFEAVNVSVEGLLIRIGKSLAIDDIISSTALFEFEKLGMSGLARVVWVEHIKPDETLIGLSYIRLERGELNGIPRFQDR